MATPYDRALKLWGIKKLNERYPFKTYGYEYVTDSVKVEMEFDEGTVCCGPGSYDADCYCSLAESPSANVKISADIAGGHKHGEFASMTIPSYMFDFATVLKEIVEAGDGEISVEKGA